MLPDFPKLKSTLSARVAAGAQAYAEGMPLLQEVGAFRQIEGRKSLMIRADGSEAVIDYKNPIHAEVSITVDDMRRAGSNATIRAMQQIGEQLGEGMTTHMFETIQKAVDEVGNTVDGRGRPLSAEVILETLDKMEFSFAPDGTWQPPTFVVHPDTFAKSELSIQGLEHDAAVKAELDKMIARKREEWNAREARRTLVD